MLCCGNIVFDVLVRPVEELAWNTTRWVDAIDTGLGGNGANTAFAIAKLGVPARLAGYAGRDTFGERALARLAEAGVDLRHVVRTEAPTPATVALVRSNADRMFLHRPGASAEAFAQPLAFTPELIAGCAYFHLANPFALPNMRRHAAETLRRARDAGLSTSMDTGWDSRGRWLEDLGGALAHIDVLFANEEEALKLSGCPDFASAAVRLRGLGARTVVVKRGAAGCALFGAGEAFPAFRVEAVDTTGAGDCFAGGFLAALARGESLWEAARIANAVAALSVAALGATTGLRSWDETRAWMGG